MRKRIFRGKSKLYNKWLYGSLLQNETYKSDTYIAEYCLSNLSYNQSPVLPNSVGEFTGWYDINKKPIFEGDIVRIKGNPDNNDWREVDYNALIIFEDGGFCAIDGTVTDYGFRRYDLIRGGDFTVEVIGNNYENPEFIEC